MTNRIGRAEVVAPHGEAAETSGAGSHMGPPLRRIRSLSLFRRGNSPSPLSRYARHLPLIRGVVPSPTGFKKTFRVWVGEPLGAPVGGVRAKKSPSSVWPSGQPPSPWKGEGSWATARVAPTAIFALGAFARQTQARKWNRTGGNFCKPRAQWPGRNCGKPLKFCAPEILQNLISTRPP